MAINERLLQTLMQQNPGLSFALQESFPFKNLYADAVPLGPIMELNASSSEHTFTSDQAAQSLEFWRTTAQTVLADPDAASSEVALKTWSHEANAAANLLSAHGYGAEAEQAYRYSNQIWPGNPDAISGLAKVLAGSGRMSEANQLLDNFARSYPDQSAAIEKTRGTFAISADPTKPKP
jgi:hypothetical protein